MLTRNKFYPLALLLAIAAMLAVVACGSTETVEVEVTRVVESTVEVERTVEVPVTQVVERTVTVVEEREIERTVEVPVTQIVQVVDEREIEVTRVVQVTVQAPEGPKETIIFGDLTWDSAQLQNRIAQYITEYGYGYPTETKLGDTLPLFEGLKRGDTDVTMEIWLPNQDEAWNKARADGAVLSVGRSLGTDWQSAFVIPAYLQEQYPDLDSVEDLTDPQYKELFATAETGGKARLVSCVIGWACETVNAAQVEGYELSDHVHVVNPGSGAAMNADLFGAYERQEPWLGYQWGTNDPALKLDLVRLEEPAYSDQCWFTTKACAYEDATILIAVNPDLPGEAPDVVQMLRNWDFNVDIYKAVVQWQAENEGVDAAATALWWLTTNQDIWSEWVTDEAEGGIVAALSNGLRAEGWPEE